MSDKTDPVAALLAGVRGYANTTDETTGRDVLIAGTKQYLAELDDTAFAALVAEVRPPAEHPDDTPAYPPSWGFQAQ